MPHFKKVGTLEPPGLDAVAHVSQSYHEKSNSPIGIQALSHTYLLHFPVSRPQRAISLHDFMVKGYGGIEVWGVGIRRRHPTALFAQSSILPVLWPRGPAAGPRAQSYTHSHSQ